MAEKPVWFVESKNPRMASENSMELMDRWYSEVHRIIPSCREFFLTTRPKDDHLEPNQKPLCGIIKCDMAALTVEIMERIAELGLHVYCTQG